jgi:flagellar biosynthesis/type III secretory pathway M-ring protein FliF/YscJ
MIVTNVIAITAYASYAVCKYNCKGENKGIPDWLLLLSMVICLTNVIFQGIIQSIYSKISDECKTDDMDTHKMVNIWGLAISGVVFAILVAVKIIKSQSVDKKEAEKIQKERQKIEKELEEAQLAKLEKELAEKKENKEAEKSSRKRRRKLQERQEELKNLEEEKIEE